MKLKTTKTALAMAAMMFSLEAGVLQLTDQSNFSMVNAIPETKMVQLHTKITNISASSANIQVIKTRLALPNKWDVAMCVESCLPPFMDTLEYVLAGGKEVSLDVDFIFEDDASTGEGAVQFTIINLDDKTEKYERLYGVNFTPVAKPTETLAFSFESAGTISKIGQMTQLHGSLKSTRNEKTSVILKRRALQAPQNWDITMCVNDLCLPPFIEESEFDIAPNGQVSLDIDVTPTDSGVAFLAFDLKDTKTDEQVSMLFSFPTYGSSATPVLGSQGKAIAPVALAVRGSMAELKLPFSGAARVELVDFRGRKIAELFNGNANASTPLLFSMQGHSAGNYLLTVVQNGVETAMPFVYTGK